MLKHSTRQFDDQSLSAAKPSQQLWTSAACPTVDHDTRPEYDVSSSGRPLLSPSCVGIMAAGEQKFAKKVQDLAEELAELVCRSSINMPLAMAFIREPYLKYGDKSDILAGLTSIGSALFKVLSLRDCDVSKLTDEIRRFQVSWSFLLIVAEVGFDETDMEVILANASTMIVNAYDGESYLCWMRSGVRDENTTTAHRSD